MKQLPTVIRQEETHEILCPCEGRKDTWFLVIISTRATISKRSCLDVSWGAPWVGHEHFRSAAGQRDGILPSKKPTAQNSWEKAACLSTKWAGCQANWGAPSPTQSHQGPALSWAKPPLAGELLWHSRHSLHLPLPPSLPAGSSPLVTFHIPCPGHHGSVKSSQAERPSAVKATGARRPVCIYKCPLALAHLPTRVHTH